MVMEKWVQLGNVFEQDGLLSKDLKEQVRRTLAQGNRCEYCKAKGKPEPSCFNEKTSIAVGFAEVFLKQNGNLSNPIFDLLRESFTDEEISELGAFITFTTASQSFGALMQLEANTDDK